MSDDVSGRASGYGGDRRVDVWGGGFLLRTIWFDIDVRIVSLCADLAGSVWKEHSRGMSWTLTWWGSLLTAPSTELMDYYVIHEYSSNESERGTGNPLFDDRCVSRIRLSLHRCEPYEEGFIYRAGRIFTMDLALFLTFLRGVFCWENFQLGVYMDICLVVQT